MPELFCVECADNECMYSLGCRRVQCRTDGCRCREQDLEEQELQLQLVGGGGYS